MNGQTLQLFFSIAFLAFLAIVGCAVPDLGDSETLEDAKRKAIPIDSLDRKLMHELIVLYVDQEEEPYTGWVREDHPNKTLKTLGFLKKGQKFGLWLHWHENQTMRLASEWHQDRLQGSYKEWHDNKRAKVVGQTFDGEVNGEWKGYYRNGSINSHSHTQMGKLEWMKVWTPDGSPCPLSKVENGNGAYWEYDEDGSRILRRVFSQGVERKAQAQSGK